MKGKIIFICTIFVILMGTVYALAITIKESGTLSNEVVSSAYTKRNTISGTANLGLSVKAYMTNVKSVTGSNADGGIRVKTTCKRYSLGVVVTSKDLYVPIYKTTTTSSSAVFNFSTSSSKTKVQWQNWTGDTSFKATFNAKDNS